MESPVASRGGIARRRRQVLVAGGQPSTRRLAFTLPGIPTHPELAFGPTWLALSTVTLDASARWRAGWLAIGLAVTPHWGARATNVLAHGRSWVSAQRNLLEARSAARSGTSALTFPTQNGTARRPAHRRVVRRRRAQGNGLPRSYEPLMATSRATRLACGLAQGAPWCVATAVLAHARPRHACLAQPSVVQRCSTRWGGGATTIPCTISHGSTTGSHPRSSHDGSGAQGHERPGSPFPSRCGSPAGRWPAHSQGIQGDTSRHRRGITGKRPRGRNG
jgi:hypothetical protein